MYHIIKINLTSLKHVSQSLNASYRVNHTDNNTATNVSVSIENLGGVLLYHVAVYEAALERVALKMGVEKFTDDVIDRIEDILAEQGYFIERVV